MRATQPGGFVAMGLLALCAGCGREPPAAKAVATLPAELEPFKRAIEKSKLEYVRVSITQGQGEKPWSSTFLGRAYRPKGTEWPLDREGRPMALLAQINFTEVPALAGYPDEGLLQFFVSPGEGQHIWGMSMYDEKPFVPDRYFESLTEPAYFQVRYFPAVDTDEARLDVTSPPPTGDGLPVFAAARLSFSLASEYVPPSDYRFKRVFGRDPYDLFESVGPRASKVSSDYYDFASPRVAAKIGGYATFVQDDPRTIRPTEDWLVLLEIQSTNEGGVDIMWGDAGVGAFLIRRADLEKRDFSHVAYYWDNH